MESTKTKLSIVKEAATNTNTTIQKIKAYLPPLLLAVVIATAFFIHEGFPLMPDNYYQAEANWEAAKSKNSKALNALKQLNTELYRGKITSDEFSTRQPELMAAYELINKEKNELYEILERTESEARVLQFDSIQFFLGELGWAVGLLLYAFFNLLYIFYLKKGHNNIKIKGRVILHSIMLFIGLFYTCYVFYSKKDFSSGWYFMAMILSSIILIIASKFIVDAYLNRMAVLKENMDGLIRFVFRVRTKHYKKVAVKAMYGQDNGLVLNPTETVEDNINEFEEDFYETLDKTEL